MKKTMRITGWFLTIALASLFVLLGGVALFSPPEAAEKFARFGFPDWLRLGVALIEICAGLTLLVPRIAWYAAGSLSLLMTGALLLHVWQGDVPRALVAGLLLVLLVATGYLRHPRTFFMDRLRAAVDLVAEREIAAERQRLASGEVRAIDDSSLLTR